MSRNTFWMTAAERNDYDAELAAIDLLVKGPTTLRETNQLQAGDRVRLIGGLIRTVASVKANGTFNYRNQPIFDVIYREPASAQWSDGNSAIAESIWEVQS